MLRQAADHLELQLAAQPEGARRFSNPPTRFLSGHVTLLLRQAVPGADSVLLAQTLMGYLDPALIHHLTKECGMPMERLEAGWIDLVARVTRTELPQ